MLSKMSWHRKVSTAWSGSYLEAEMLISEKLRVNGW